MGWTVAALIFCSAARSVAIHRLSPQDADKLLSEGGVFLLDVRSQEEFQNGHIPSAVAIPLKDLPRRMKELPRDRTQPILVYCNTGDRSGRAARLLYNEGRKDVYVLLGGLRAWTAAQKPIQVPLPDGKAASTP